MARARARRPAAAGRADAPRTLLVSMVAGAAAFLKSYFPTLTMTQIKLVLTSSSAKYIKELGQYAKNAGVINLVSAVNACKKLEKKK